MNICPRCECAIVRDGFGALSRVTRDEGAEVMVCDRCGEREGLYGRLPQDQHPLSDWPLPIEVLLSEERELMQLFRKSEITMVPADRIST